MQRTDRLRIIFVLLLSLVGTVALFLPFTFNVSPFRVVSETASILFKGKLASEWGLLLLALPFFLSICILIWQARRLIVDRLTTSEIAVAYALSTAAMLPIAVLLGWATSDLVLRSTVGPSTVSELASFVALWLLFGAVVLLLIRNLRAGFPREVTAEAFLVGGYLPNSVLCLITFHPKNFFLSGWQIGAYLIAAVSVGYLAAIVLLSRKKPGGMPSPVEGK